MAEECRSVQEIAGQRNARNPENAGKTGFLESRRVSQLGYGDLIVTSLNSSPYGEAECGRLAENCSRFVQPFPPQSSRYANSSQFLGAVPSVPVSQRKGGPAAWKWAGKSGPGHAHTEDNDKPTAPLHETYRRSTMYGGRYGIQPWPEDALRRVNARRIASSTMSSFAPTSSARNRRTK